MKRKINILVDLDTYNELKKQRIDSNRSFSEIVEEAIKDYLGKKNQKQKYLKRFPNI